jgi:hypothetical protein
MAWKLTSGSTGWLQVGSWCLMIAATLIAAVLVPAQIVLAHRVRPASVAHRASDSVAQVPSVSRARESGRHRVRPRADSAR